MKVFRGSCQGIFLTAADKSVRQLNIVHWDVMSKRDIQVKAALDSWSNTPVAPDQNSIIVDGSALDTVISVPWYFEAIDFFPE